MEVKQFTSGAEARMHYAQQGFKTSDAVPVESGMIILTRGTEMVVIAHVGLLDWRGTIVDTEKL